MPIGPPKFDQRPGAIAAITARLAIVATLCVVQYWLLTTSMEAYHAGARGVLLPAFLASAACFLLGLGLVITGELGSRRVADEIAREPEPPRDVYAPPEFRDPE
jgi:hypothetical protein